KNTRHRYIREIAASYIARTNPNTAPAMMPAVAIAPPSAMTSLKRRCGCDPSANRIEVTATASASSGFVLTEEHRLKLIAPVSALRRRIANLTAIIKESFINKGVPEAWERENECLQNP